MNDNSDSLSQNTSSLFFKKTHTAPLTELLIETEYYGSIYYCQNTE